MLSLQYPTGLFSAAPNTKTGYHRVWIRDNIYALFGLEAKDNFSASMKTVHALLDILKKHAYKIDWMIKQPQPKEGHRYIHPRNKPPPNPPPINKNKFYTTRNKK